MDVWRFAKIYTKIVYTINSLHYNIIKIKTIIKINQKSFVNSIVNYFHTYEMRQMSENQEEKVNMVYVVYLYTRYNKRPNK